ncbi:MAG: NUDIX domain-containing protein [Naasia sp.]
MPTPRRSAGLLLFRRAPTIEVLIGHMGGPFWARKADAAWSIPKGEVESGEDELAAALREFSEELGLAVPASAMAEAVDLGTVRQSSGKIVHVWAAEADLDTSVVVPGSFEMEWPPGSGITATYPELDRVEWSSVEQARRRLIVAQRQFVDRLELLIAG